LQRQSSCGVEGPAVSLCGQDPRKEPTADLFRPSEQRLVWRGRPPAKARIDSKRGDSPGSPAEQSSAEDAMSRPKRGAQKFHDISSRCHPEQSEGSMHSACGISEWPTLQRFSAVILSAADTSQSEVPAESRDPFAVSQKSSQSHRTPGPTRQGVGFGDGTQARCLGLRLSRRGLMVCCANP
jgi:hypothetical protein